MNKENAHLYLPLVEALRDGELQVKWNENTQWIDCKDCDFTAPPQHYRRRPKPKTVPLEMGDLPFPCAVRPSMQCTWHIINAGDEAGVDIHCLGVRSFAQLRDNGWLYSPTPQDPTSWRRCEKEVEG